MTGPADGVHRGMFNSVYDQRSVFVTGHTGFKGSWLCLWLEHLGARLTAYARPPATDPNHFELLQIAGRCVTGDICHADDLAAQMAQCQPEIVFHLAAQASVLYSYENPLETFASNVLGTANVLEACRRTPSVRALVVVTTDKCYENREWLWGYRESDTLGGHDPYSASKACTELVVAAYRRSFLSQGSMLVASARAGNVVGGGDWTADRLVPDVMRAAAQGQTAIIRNPRSCRPWQHVLEPLSAYLLLGQLLFEGRRDLAQAWNIGPRDADHVAVLSVVEGLQQCWPAVAYEIAPEADKPHEAGLLRLDCAKARTLLGWEPVWGRAEMLAETAAWYRSFYQRGEVLSTPQIAAYTACAVAQNAVWTKG